MHASFYRAIHYIMVKKSCNRKITWCIRSNRNDDCTISSFSLSSPPCRLEKSHAENCITESRKWSPLVTEKSTQKVVSRFFIGVVSRSCTHQKIMRSEAHYLDSVCPDVVILRKSGAFPPSLPSIFESCAMCEKLKKWRILAFFKISCSKILKSKLTLKRPKIQ